QMLSRPIEQITRQLQELQRATASLIRVRELLAITGTVADTGRVDLPRGPLAVAFEGVTFGYEADERVLSDLSFALPAGEILGVLGRTGSGKTTLTRLLFRLYDPDSGQICLGTNGQISDVRRVPLSDIRGRVGMVTQNIQLFHATVRDNLTFFDDRIPDDQVLQVLEDVGLGKWLRSLPAGLDTELESGGSGLSAGEAQLLAFTRIFLQDPGLVILDEASSRLDPATEHLIEQAVDKLVKGRTAIVIAHRLATVQRADEVMILENGRIVEHGARAELAGDPTSHFYHLLQTGMEEMLA
ncbi:MAG TPA: ABC transporter ATP-binding protein, partial [Anaerolineae bacterium]|nr:ABC transporter ATP-binding protein [Anaerolineae bacterium]